MQRWEGVAGTGLIAASNFWGNWGLTLWGSCFPAVLFMRPESRGIDSLRPISDCSGLPLKGLRAASGQAGPHAPSRC